MDLIIAAGFNNEANALEKAGDFDGAVKKHLAALEIKEKSTLDAMTTIALTKNGLGELYLKMGKLEQAQEMLEGAYHIRGLDANFDTSCTADNLGKLYEMKGDLENARRWRKINGTNRMLCSYFECPKSVVCMFSALNELKTCAKCKSAYYCGEKCQKDDWSRHKQFCKATMGEANPVNKI